MSGRLIETTDLVVAYGVARGRPWGKRTIRAVDGASIGVTAGSSLGVVGETGAGKSSLGRAIVGLTEPRAGSISFEGRDLGTLSRSEMRGIRPQMQMIFQDARASLDPRKKIGTSIAEPLRAQGRGQKGEWAARVDELSTRVGLSVGMRGRYPHQLSGGQRQRVAIARALSSSPKLIVCDEPISGLDVSAQGQILNLLLELKSAFGLTYVFIGHNLAVMRLLSDELVVMYCGKVVESGSAATVLSTPAHPYSRALISSVPPSLGDNRSHDRPLLHGDLASPSNPPPGCRFHPRCWLYEQLGRPEVCRTVLPELDGVAPTQHSACHFSDAAKQAEVSTA